MFIRARSLVDSLCHKQLGVAITSLRPHRVFIIAGCSLSLTDGFAQKVHSRFHDNFRDVLEYMTYYLRAICCAMKGAFPLVVWAYSSLLIG